MLRSRVRCRRRFACANQSTAVAKMAFSPSQKLMDFYAQVRLA
jgi:hypothetical protein